MIFFSSYYANFFLPNFHSFYCLLFFLLSLLIPISPSLPFSFLPSLTSFCQPSIPSLSHASSLSPCLPDSFYLYHPPSLPPSFHSFWSPFIALPHSPFIHSLPPFIFITLLYSLPSPPHFLLSIYSPFPSSLLLFFIIITSHTSVPFSSLTFLTLSLFPSPPSFLPSSLPPSITSFLSSLSSFPLLPFHQCSHSDHPLSKNLV